MSEEAKSKGRCPRCKKGHVFEIECFACQGTGAIQGQICDDCLGEGFEDECDECGWQPGYPTESIES